MTTKTQPDYRKIAASEGFRRLMSRKKRFILPLSLFFLTFYFVLPVMTSYTDVLNGSALGPITWAWVFAFGQFVMTWALCTLYTRKAVQFDKMSETIKAEAGGEA